MELILAILGAGPAGYFTSTRKRGLTLYLAAWTIVFPVQTIVVNSTVISVLCTGCSMPSSSWAGSD